jgi:hypothetical protein
VPAADHRRTPSRKAYVPPAWFLVGSVVVCLAAAGWLGWLLLDRADDDASRATPTSSTSSPAASATTPTPTPSPSATTASPTPTPKPKPKPTPTKTTPPPVQRDAPVSVLNNTGISGRARTFSGVVSQAGWNVVAVGNWRGSVPGNTVYYPGGLEDEAKLLAADVGIGRVLPSVAPMRMDRLTVILSGPQ